jgi:hypothetical protein
MFERHSAGEVEKSLLEKDEGLIAGGSSYGNIFAGGAAESHVCASTADWVSVLKAWNPYSLLVSFLLTTIDEISFGDTFNDLQYGHCGTVVNNNPSQTTMSCLVTS